MIRTLTPSNTVPGDLLGLNLGAVGLALKMVVFAFIQINIQLWFNCKFLNILFIRLFLHQIYTLLLFALISYLSLWFGDIIAKGMILPFIINGLLYTILSIFLVIIFPSIISLSRKELKKYFNLVVKR